MFQFHVLVIIIYANKIMHYYKKQPDYTTFLSYLLELHNLVTLLNARKMNIQSDEDRYWYRETAMELKKLNDKLLSFSSEFLELTDKIEASKYAQQLFVLQANKTDEYFISLNMRMLGIRQQKSIVLSELNKFSDEMENSENENQIYFPKRLQRCLKQTI